MHRISTRIPNPRTPFRFDIIQCGRIIISRILKRTKTVSVATVLSKHFEQRKPFVVEAPAGTSWALPFDELGDGARYARWSRAGGTFRAVGSADGTVAGACPASVRRATEVIGERQIYR